MNKGKLKFTLLFLLSSMSTIRVYAQQPETAQELELMKGYPAEKGTEVNKGNWMSPPFNRWSFQNAQKLFSTASINKGTEAAKGFNLADSKYSSLLTKVTYPGDMTLDSFMLGNYVDGLLVLKGGDIVLERYNNGQTKETRHSLFSVTKSFIGLVAELLIDDGIIEPENTVASYLPELTKSGYGDATVRQVMDMEASIEFNEDYDDPKSSISQFLYASGVRVPPVGIADRTSLYQFLPTINKAKEHGEKFKYISATTEVLGWIITRVAKADINQLMSDKFYRKLGMQRDAYIALDAQGKAVSAGGMSMTLRDLARFALMLSNDGLVDGKQVLPSKVIKQLKKGGNKAHFLKGYNRKAWSYKSQWWFNHDNNTMMAIGIHGQIIYISLDTDVVAVIQSSWPRALNNVLRTRREQFFAGVLKALSD